MSSIRPSLENEPRDQLEELGCCASPDFITITHPSKSAIQAEFDDLEPLAPTSLCLRHHACHGATNIPTGSASHGVPGRPTINLHLSAASASHWLVSLSCVFELWISLQ